MLRIAIVDDEEEQLDMLERIVLEFFRERTVEVTINRFTRGESFISDCECYDVVFLDIHMGGMDGIETAQRLRTKDKRTALFYVTSYQGYIRKCMTIHPFAFIVKPFSEEEIRLNLEDYLEYMRSLKTKAVEVYQLETYDDRHVNININDILYFHYLENRIVEVVSADRKYKIKDGIMRIYSTLDHEYFIMPQQSFIINLRHVREVDGKNKKLVMDNGDLILIPRRKYNEIIELLNRYIAYGKV